MAFPYIVLVGPPNAGKTTLFNQLTGQNSKIVNYPGSTVDVCVGTLPSRDDDVKYTIVDTPGLYSLRPQSDDERITLRCLQDIRDLTKNKSQYPDLVVSLVDVKQASRHLLLTQQLIEQGYPVVVVLNRSSRDSNDAVLNSQTLASELNVPVLELDVATSKSKSSFETFLEHYSFSAYTPSSSINTVRSVYKRIEGVLDRSGYKYMDSSKFDLDRIFLHPFFGPVAFVLIMALFFYSLFAMAAPLMDLTESMFSAFNILLYKIFPFENSFMTLLTDGLVNGLAAVFVFVPQILLLFFGMGLLESVGYLSRAAVIIDKPLSYFGLNGRCFVPLLSGYACAIPALLATRNIQQEKIKKLCSFVIPLTQCSARLPVYGLLISMLFGHDAWKSGLVLTAIYCGSLLLIAIVSLVAAPFIKGSTSSQFTLELPEWRKPSFSLVLYQAWRQTLSFITGAGPMIVGIAIVLWALSVYPSEQHSFVMMIGSFIEPIFSPMGVDWRVGVAILLSFAAREVFVSALVIMFSLTSTETSIVSVLKTATFTGTDQLIFTTPVIIGLLLFFMIAMQCGATLVVVRSEMKSRVFPAVQLFAYIALAYIVSVGIVTFLS